jgi:hypothetical protein
VYNKEREKIREVGNGRGWYSTENEGKRGMAAKCNHFYKGEYNNGSHGIKFF